MSDLKKSAQQVIVDQINADNADLNLLTTEVSFGVPVVETGAKNTSLLLTAAAGGRFLSTQTIYYDRVNMADIRAAVIGAGLTVVFDKTDEVTTIGHLIALVNARFGINLTTDDYTSDPFPTFQMVPNEQHNVVITAKATSLVYTGAMTVSLRLPQVDLAVAISANTLNGLTYSPPTP